MDLQDFKRKRVSIMYFEELSIEQKTEATINYFRNKDKLIAKGRKEADQFTKENYSKIKKNLKGEKKVSMKG